MLSVAAKKYLVEYKAQQANESPDNSLKSAWTSEDKFVIGSKAFVLVMVDGETKTIEIGAGAEVPVFVLPKIQVTGKVDYRFKANLNDTSMTTKSGALDRRYHPKVNVSFSSRYRISKELANDN